MNSKRESRNDMHTVILQMIMSLWYYLHVFWTTWQIVHFVIERFGFRSAVSYWTANIFDVAYKW